jgi:Domain of unknown function (DUF5122) beta-propeller
VDGTGKVLTSVSIQQDGKILIGGGFYSFNNVRRSGLVRLFGADMSLFLVAQLAPTSRLVKFDATANPGKRLAVESSTDLKSWGQ